MRISRIGTTTQTPAYNFRPAPLSRPLRHLSLIHCIITPSPLPLLGTFPLVLPPTIAPYGPVTVHLLLITPTDYHRKRGVTAVSRECGSPRATLVPFWNHLSVSTHSCTDYISQIHLWAVMHPMHLTVDGHFAIHLTHPLLSVSCRLFVSLSSLPLYHSSLTFFRPFFPLPPFFRFPSYCDIIFFSSSDSGLHIRKQIAVPSFVCIKPQTSDPSFVLSFYLFSFYDTFMTSYISLIIPPFIIGPS